MTLCGAGVEIKETIPEGAGAGVKEIAPGGAGAGVREITSGRGGAGGKEIAPSGAGAGGANDGGGRRLMLRKLAAEPIISFLLMVLH